MPRWLPRILARVRALAARRRVLLTRKARWELDALDLGLDFADACEVLAALRASDFARRLVSARTGEWMYVWTPSVAGTTRYVKLVLRGACVVVSFHADEDGDDDSIEG